MISYRFFLIGILIIIVGFIINHVFEAEKCVKSCIMFDDLNANECVIACNSIDNRFNNWLNWYHIDKYPKTDDPICFNNNDNEVKILKQKPASNFESLKELPNIIIIMMDDASNYVDPMFDVMPFSKELFKLNGTEFSNAFTSTSFCCPARCQFFTGMYGHSNGVISSTGSYSSMEAFIKPLHLNESRQINPSNGKCINNLYRSINMYMKQKNYSTALFGKYLNGHESSNSRFHSMNFVPVGWDKFDMCVNNYMYIGNMYVMAEYDIKTNKVEYKWYGRKEEDYLTDVIGNKVVKFLKENKNEKLFVVATPTAPHCPMTSAYRHRHLLTKWDSKFDEVIANRPNYHNLKELETKSSWLRNNAKERQELLKIKPFYYKKEPVNIHRLEFRKRMASYASVDDGIVKKIYDEVKSQGKLNNTIFILTSDNGFNEGAHGLGHKMSGYEESIRIPLFISGSPFMKGHVDNRLTLINDIAPTILDIIGLIPPSHIDGKSLLGQKFLHRKSVLLEYGKRKKSEKYTGTLKDTSEFKMITDISPEPTSLDVPPYVGIRTDSFTLIEYYNQTNSSFTEHEMYDLRRDKYQLKNLIGDKFYSHIEQDLKRRLKKLEICSGQECNEI